ncbi:MAG: hypothetical protein SFY69_05970 [Planctomycetota bacterium]|nr:hypothetical protein [Planctomycetota bacterium]
MCQRDRSTHRPRTNGLGFRTMWQYDTDADATLEDEERYYLMHDERWRAVATFRNADTSPKEAFVHHAGAWLSARKLVAGSAGVRTLTP